MQSKDVTSLTGYYADIDKGNGDMKHNSGHGAFGRTSKSQNGGLLPKQFLPELKMESRAKYFTMIYKFLQSRLQGRLHDTKM